MKHLLSWQDCTPCWLWLCRSPVSMTPVELISWQAFIVLLSLSNPKCWVWSYFSKQPWQGRIWTSFLYLQGELALYFNMDEWVQWGGHHYLQGRSRVAEAEFIMGLLQVIFNPSMSKESSLKCHRKHKHLNTHNLFYITPLVSTAQCSGYPGILKSLPLWRYLKAMCF